MLRRGLAGTATRPTQGLGLFLVLGTVSVIGPASMDSYLPGLPRLAHDLDVSAAAGQLTVTTFLVGLALGQIVSGPLSDARGRRKPLIAGMAVFTVVSVLAGLAPDLPALAGIRLVQGASAATGLAIGRAIVRDLYSGAAAARYLSRLMLMIGLGPIVAPVIGAQILRITSWRGTFFALALFGTALTWTSARLLPETLPPERRRTGGARQGARTFKMLLADRQFIAFVVVSGAGGGAILTYIAGSAFVLEKVYGATTELYAVLFGINALLLVIGAQVNAHLLKTHAPRSLLGVGSAAMVASSVALFCALPFRDVGLVALMPPLALLCFSWSFIQSNAFALALTPHPKVAGAASAVLGVAQYLCGAALAPLVAIGRTHSAMPMAAIIGFCSIACALVLRRFVPRRNPVAAMPVTPEALGTVP